MNLVSFVQFPAAAERVLKDSRCKELHLNLQFCYKCTIQQEIIFGYDEKRLFMAPMWPGHNGFFPQA